MQFYVDNCLFYITDRKLPAEKEEGWYILGNASADQVQKHYEMVQNRQVLGVAKMLFYVADIIKARQQLMDFFTPIEAAGGLIEEDGRILFILRNGLWDLPKGKVEAKEATDAAALREVEEECGLKASIDTKLGETWHTYPHKGKNMLKCTHWYKMAPTEENQELAPQLEEGITEIKWISTPDIPYQVYKHTYASIQSIVAQYLG